MNYSDLSEFVFEFLNEFFIHEADGIQYVVSDEVYEERLSVCRSCVHYDEPENGCKKCGCYLTHKARDPFASCPIEEWDVDNRQWLESNYEHILDALRDRTGKYD